MTHPRRGLALALALLLSLIAAAPAVADPADDQLYTHQWALEDPGYSNPGFPWFTDAVADADIDAEAAWAAVGDDAPPVTVAVADERIDLDQPDLAGRFVQGTTPAPSVPNAAGCTATHPDHGTAVAGVVAAARNNGIGIAGVAPNARILPVQALDDCGAGTEDTVLDAFRYAVANQAQIVVASFATDPLLPAARKAELKQTFDGFFEDHLDTLFVVAAGNEGNDNDANPVYPCSSDAANVICVGRSNIDDSPACQSNVGHASVDLFAPGDRIYTTRWSDGQHALTDRFNGTSMSAPLVAGVAALVWNLPSRLPPAAATANAITDGVDGRDTMTGISLAGGRLNAAGALSAAGLDGVSFEDRLGPAWGHPWQSCDPDHDGFAAGADACPTAAGPTPNGCPPDADSDGVPDSSDNCPAAANANQANADGDGFGDACDSTPRGPDSDGDGVPALDDACPAQAGTLANGCPAPATYVPPVADPPVVAPVALRVVSVRVSALPCRAHGRCSRTAKVTVTLTRTAGTAVTVEKRVTRGHRRVWERVLRRTLTATASGRTLTVPRLGRGAYRVTASVTGAPAMRRTFRI